MNTLIIPQASTAVGAKLDLAIKNTRELDQAHAHILLFGETKSGKTTCATSIVEPELIRVVSTQPEEQLAHLKKLGIDYVRVRTAREIDHVLDAPRQFFPGEWSTLVIDDYTELINFYETRFRNEIKDGRQVYKAIKDHARNSLEALLEGDYHLIVTALERSLDDDFKMPWIKPDLPPSTMSLITSKFSFIFYCLGSPNFKLLTRRDTSRRIFAGNRLPKAAIGAFKDEETSDLKQLWAKYQVAIH